jgi:predicted O-methyltransferase YrrM
MSLINPQQLEHLVSLAAETPPGDWVEVGVFRGGSAAKLAEKAREQGRRLWLFDTFTGVPCQHEKDSHHKVGDFGDTSLDEVRALIPDAMFVVGDCRETLGATPLERIAFAHIDCDQYESVRACILELSPRMAPGGVMWFDDYLCTTGATYAVEELLAGRVEVHPCDKYFVRF